MGHNFWLVVKYWVANNFGLKFLGQSFLVIAKIWINKEIWIIAIIWVSKKLGDKNFTSLKFSSIVNEGAKQSAIATKKSTDIQKKSTNI